MNEYVNVPPLESGMFPRVTLSYTLSADKGVNVQTEESLVRATRYWPESDIVPPYVIMASGLSESDAGLLITRGVCESIIENAEFISESN